jgi:hypothetical protein
MYNQFSFSNQRVSNGNYDKKARSMFKIETNAKRAAKINTSTTKYILNKNDRVYITASDNIEKKMASFIQESKNSSFCK